MQGERTNRERPNEQGLNPISVCGRRKKAHLWSDASNSGNKGDETTCERCPSGAMQSRPRWSSRSLAPARSIILAAGAMLRANVWPTESLTRAGSNRQATAAAAAVVPAEDTALSLRCERRAASRLRVKIFNERRRSTCQWALREDAAANRKRVRQRHAYLPLTANKTSLLLEGFAASRRRAFSCATHLPSGPDPARNNIRAYTGRPGALHRRRSARRCSLLFSSGVSCSVLFHSVPLRRAVIGWKRSSQVSRPGAPTTNKTLARSKAAIARIRRICCDAAQASGPINRPIRFDLATNVRAGAIVRIDDCSRHVRLDTSDKEQRRMTHMYTRSRRRIVRTICARASGFDASSSTRQTLKLRHLPDANARCRLIGPFIHSRPLWGHGLSHD